ncbi:MAG: restriction endonuclease [Nitrospiraceae bacterium]|nr:restriction endonuclease [Nitrospiraceae bacterium]
MRKLRPLIERIEKTDELIDQVVYRLYGLSEEEIKVIGLAVET